jgi:hypothetical protein
VDKIVFCVTGKTREPVAASKDERCLLHEVPELPVDMTSFDILNIAKDRGEAEAWEKLGFTRDDYRLAVDLDEFQAYPWSLREIVQEMAARNEWALAGMLVDRFAVDYSTPPIRPAAQISLEDQFPVVRQWPLRDWPEILDQKTPWGACMIKVAVCKGAVEIGSGRHHAKNAVIARHAQFGFYLTDLKVHHFRWCAGVTETLQTRGADPRWDDRYRAECNAGLKWIAEQQQAARAAGTQR